MKKVFFLFALTLIVFACQENKTIDSKTESEKAEITSELPETAFEDTTNAINPVVTEQVAEVDSVVTSGLTTASGKSTEVEATEKEVSKEPVKPKVKKKRAKINFESKKWSFGDIRDGDIIKHDFKFKNSGDADLLIKNVTASCGCTQPSFPFLPIPPGEEGVIGVTFNSTGKINAQRPTVTVVTNGKPSIYKLYLEGNVLQKIEN